MSPKTSLDGFRENKISSFYRYSNLGLPSPQNTGNSKSAKQVSASQKGLSTPWPWLLLQLTCSSRSSDCVNKQAFSVLNVRPRRDKYKLIFSHTFFHILMTRNPYWGPLCQLSKYVDRITSGITQIVTTGLKQNFSST